MTKEKRTAERDRAGYVDTPAGVFTAAGVWFHASEADLRAYAAPVLERVPLERLLRYAEAWLRLPEAAALWAAPALLFALPPLPAVLAVLVLYAGCRVVAPSFTSLAGVRVVRVLDVVWLQALYYLVGLSLLSFVGEYAAVGVGLGVFVAARWGLLARGVGLLTKPLEAHLYDLPVPDQVLRGFLIRVALRHGLSLPQLDRIERQIAANLRRHV